MSSLLLRWPVLRHGLRERRRSLLWWSLGVAVYIAIIAAVWPSIKSAPGLAELEQQLPEVLLQLMGAENYSMATGAGFISGELFGFMIPIFVMVLTIGAGGAAIAGAEDRGVLDLVLSHPITRRSVFRQSAALIALDAIIFGVVIVVSLMVASPIVNLGLSFPNVLGAVTGIVLLGIVFGWLALAIGAATGSRPLALGISGAAGALLYLASSLSGIVDWLRNAKWFSPFWWATNDAPLVNGFIWWHAPVMIGAGLVVCVVGAYFFSKRNLAA
jgi:ABC-2 type transport system permease protein